MGKLEFRWAVLLVAALSLDAQNPDGQIRVQVKDPSGASMQASGKLESLAPGVQRTFETDALGTYTISNLPHGRYRLEVSKTGFATQSVVIDVQSATPVSRTLTMALGAQASKVDVVSATPLAGTDLSTDQIAAPVQTATAADMKDSGALDLGDFMNRRLNGVYFNEMQGNPFQPDVNFRGYTASPLLGTPEGISVYLDGVRQNQPFGDVVSWDLIPKIAISEVTLVPGSDPLFGLNTLGGALSVQTKDGVSNPGLDGALTYGSSGRKAVQAEWGGGKATGFNWFLAANAFHESGWRFDSPSDVRQGFARLGWRTDKTDLALTMSYAYNTLIGNGLQDYRLLENNYSSVYSIPDSTANRSPSFNFIARHTFSDALTFSGNAWFRNIRTEGIDANFNTDVLGKPIYQPIPQEQAALTAAGYTGFPTSGANITNTPFPKWRCIAEALLSRATRTRHAMASTSTRKKCRTSTDFPASLPGSPRPKSDRTSSPPERRSIAAASTTRRTRPTLISIPTTPSPAFRRGRTDRQRIGRSRSNLHGLTPNWSLYFTDTLTLAKTVNVTVSGRYNRFTIDNLDRINPNSRPRLARWRLCVSAIQSRRRDYLEPDLHRECLREILPGQPRADFH